MNFLAHAYLSGSDNAEVLMGNMMGDFVKGKQYLNYSPAIQKGILLHRAIDAYTDAHALLHEAKLYFRKDYGLYSGVLLDVMWDHFLANDSRIFKDAAHLNAFCQNVYDTITEHKHLMTERMAYITKYMIEYNWLYHYKDVEGITKSWRGMSKRVEHLPEADAAVQIFSQHYRYFREVYDNLIIALQQKFLTSSRIPT